MPRQKLLSGLQGEAAAISADYDLLKDTQASLEYSSRGIETEIRELLQGSQKLASAFAALNSG